MFFHGNLALLPAKFLYINPALKPINQINRFDDFSAFKSGKLFAHQNS